MRPKASRCPPGARKGMTAGPVVRDHEVVVHHENPGVLLRRPGEGVGCERHLPVPQAAAHDGAARRRGAQGHDGGPV